jgi:hypothetical protein
MPIVKIVPMPGPQGPGGSGEGGDIADFVFTNVDSTNSSITVTGNKELTIQSGASQDLNVRAGDDLWLTADDNIFVQADDEVNLRSQSSTTIITNYVDQGDEQYEWQFGSQGYLTLPGGGEIINSPDSSGDSGGYSTLKLDPDNTLESDQYIIIDPTGPNHIHIRAGGTQDDSSADLFLGGELNNVQVSDQGREVIIRAREEDTTYTALNVNYVSGESFVLSMETEIVEGDSVLINDVYYPVQNLVLDSPSAGLQTFTVTGRTFTSNETYTFYRTSYYSNYWRFKSDGSILFPDDTVQTTAYTGGANGDLVVPTAIKDSEGDDFITFTRTSTNTARIATPQDDLSLRSARDITLFPGSDGDGNVYIGWGDAELTPDATNRVATIGDVQAATGLGDITFDGVKIIGAGTASGDGLGAGTMQLVPDADLYANDQYLIIDPTDPNHIHIRAGGQQDNSTADLILGGERTNVRVSDTNGTVYISSKRPDTTDTYENVNGDGGPIFAIFADLSNISPNENFSVEVGGTLYVIDSVQVLDIEGSPVTEITATPATFVTGESYTIHESNYENNWAFNENGYLTGPAMGGLFVSGILNGESDLWLGSSGNVVLSPGEGEAFIDDTSNPDNQIATIGDLGSDTTFTVAGGTLGTQPTFTGAPLFTGSYVRTGPMVHFRIDVDFDNITSFGTGQYYLDLPFPAKYNYEFTAGCLHDISETRDYPMTGHVYAGESRMLLKSLDSQGNSAFAVPFTATTPVTLAVADNFHISGNYIVDTEAP